MIEEIYKTKTRETALGVSNTKITSVRTKDIEKTALRLYKDGKIGISGSIGTANIDNLKKKALKNINLDYKIKPNGDHQESRDHRAEIISEDLLLSRSEEILGSFREKYPNFAFFNKISLFETEISIKNNIGLDLSYKNNTLGFGLLMKEKNSPNILDAAITYQEQHFDTQKIYDFSDKFVSAYHNKVDLPKGKKLPVAFLDNSLVKKFATDLNIEKIRNNTSIFTNKMHQDLFNKNFSLDIFRSHEDLNCFFDLNGSTLNDDRFNIISSGEIFSAYSDKLNSHKYDTPDTACASGKYDDIPSLAVPMGLLKVKESEKTAKDLFNGELGILVVFAMGGDYTPDGNFSTPVQLAYLYDGEKFIGKLPELKVSGHVYDIFGDSFRGKANDPFSDIHQDKVFVVDMLVEEM